MPLSFASVLPVLSCLLLLLYIASSNQYNIIQYLYLQCRHPHVHVGSRYLAFTLYPSRSKQQEPKLFCASGAAAGAGRESSSNRLPPCLASPLITVRLPLASLPSSHLLDLPISQPLQLLLLLLGLQQFPGPSNRLPIPLFLLYTSLSSGISVQVRQLLN